MRRTKLDQMAETLNAEFRDFLATAMRGEFGIEVESEFSIFSLRLVTSRVDGNDFTPEQRAFLAAYERGYTDAMERVGHEACKR